MLPPPIDGTQEYLKAIHDRLGELLDRLPAKPPEPEQAGGTVELREPAAPLAEPEPVTSGQGTALRPARTPRKPAARKPATRKRTTSKEA